MYYALIDTGSIVVGPRMYKRSSFERYTTNAGIEFTFPGKYDSRDVIVVNDSIKLLPVDQTNESFDSLFEEPAGPTINILEEQVTSAYGKTNRQLYAIINDITAKIVSERYNREVAGITLTIQGQEIKVTTNRGERDVYLQTYQLSDDTTVTKFKFGSVFVDLTKDDLFAIVSAVRSHVQAQFDWEAVKVAELNQLTTIEAMRDFYTNLNLDNNPTSIMM